MKFGMFVCLQLPRPWEEGAERRIYREALEQVEAGDRLGIDCVWVQEHHFLEEYSHSSAPEVFLAACSQRTSRIRLGHGIAVMPPRINPPARVAERIAALDILSDGRVEWGTGESGTRVELEGFGIDFVDKRPMWAVAVRETAKMMCATPYPGYRGTHFSMPARNVVPKPLQRPHPPLWAACSNRDSLRFAARMGMGALTFSFTNPDEARFWVEEYYETFERECDPIGRAVNPNIAMLTGFMCHPDPAVAQARGEEGAQFFAYGLGHYFRDGSHVPGRTELWEHFKGKPRSTVDAMERERKKAGMAGIGTPDELAERFRAFEEAGVDQLILLQQSGKYEQSHILESLELFGERVLPEFKRRDPGQVERKAARLRGPIAAAMNRIEPLDDEGTPPPVEAYPLTWGGDRKATGETAPDRRPGISALWRQQVGGKGPSNDGSD